MHCLKRDTVKDAPMQLMHWCPAPGQTETLFTNLGLLECHQFGAAHLPHPYQEFTITAVSGDLLAFNMPNHRRSQTGNTLELQRVRIEQKANGLP